MRVYGGPLGPPLIVYASNMTWVGYYLPQKNHSCDKRVGIFSHVISAQPPGREEGLEIVFRLTARDAILVPM